MSNYTEDLNWRYAVKKFDLDKKVTEEDLSKLLEATQLSASSYGLQPYQIFVITDKETREKLLPVTWDQKQVVDASHLIVFANKTSFGEELVDDYLHNVASTRGLSIEDLKGYGDFIKSKLNTLSDDEKADWTAKQVYLAFGNFLSAAAALKIDTCPMEGFESEEYNTILGLTENGLNAAVIAAVGYRSKDDKAQNYPKVRKLKSELFTHI